MWSLNNCWFKMSSKSFISKWNEACIWQYRLKWYEHNIRRSGYLMMILDYEGCRGEEVKNIYSVIPLSWPEWIMSHFLIWCKIFWKITYQTKLKEVWPNLEPLISKAGLRKFVLASELIVFMPYFICHLTARRPPKILWLPF